MSRAMTILAAQASETHRWRERAETAEKEVERLARLVLLQRQVGAEMAQGWNECWAELRRLQALRTEEVACEP